MGKTRIAILGSTSHIAKGLIYHFLQDKYPILHLYTRSPDKLHSFLETIGKPSNRRCMTHKGYKNFMKFPYEVIINCIGVGTLRKKGSYSDYFMVGEEYDNLVIRYLKNICADTLYISFSSGAIYGRKFKVPADKDTKNCIPVNHVTKEDYYAISRINAEAKHRSFKEFNIVDLRIFSYFSRFIDLTDGYFITELLKSILENRVFLVDNTNFVRDYLHPKDLYSMIQKCMDIGKINDAFDVMSSQPVEKKEILDYFSSHYGLKYKIDYSLKYFSPTGMKNVYYSRYDKAAKIGYKPLFSSMDTIKQEAKYILL